MLRNQRGSMRRLREGRRLRSRSAWDSHRCQLGLRRRQRRRGSQRPSEQNLLVDVQSPRLASDQNCDCKEFFSCPLVPSSPFRNTAINQKGALFPIPSSLNDIDYGLRPLRSRRRTILNLRKRHQIRLNESRTQDKSLDPKLAILPHLPDRKHVKRSFRGAILSESTIVRHAASLESATDGACSRRDIDDAWPIRRLRLL